MALRTSIAAFVVLTMMSASVEASAQETPVPPPPPPPPVVPSTATLAPPPPPGLPADRPSITTTVEAGREGVVLERHAKTEESYGRIAIVIPTHATTQGWEPVCVTPCRVELPRYSSYRVARGNGTSQSHEFTLPQTKGSLKLDIEPGDLFWNRTSRVLLGAGTAAAIVGGVLITTANSFDAEKDVRIAGIITAGAGVLLLAVGIPLYMGSRTHVKNDGQKLAGTEPRPHLTANGFVF